MRGSCRILVGASGVRRPTGTARDRRDLDAALNLITRSPALRDQLEANTRQFRTGLAATGLTLKPGSHPIVPVMIGEAAVAQDFAARMLERGVYVVGFFHPVVPAGSARIRAQVSAAHRPEDLEFAIRAFADVKRELNL